jgi:hypothetical protein
MTTLQDREPDADELWSESLASANEEIGRLQTDLADALVQLDAARRTNHGLANRLHAAEGTLRLIRELVNK